METLFLGRGLDAPLFLALLSAHLLVDFPLQPQAWVEAKATRTWRAPALYWHGALAGLLAWLFAQQWAAWWVAAVVALSHVGFDGLKARGRDQGLRAFVLDQSAHLAVLWALAAVLSRGSHAAVAPGPTLWAGASAALLVWWFEGTLIAKATRRWREQLDEAAGEPRGLRDAGLWIGRLERALIVVFVLVGRYEGVGFLIAAKSVFRFGEVTRPEQRQEAEYILVGTMASFLLAILTGLGLRALA